MADISSGIDISAVAQTATSQASIHSLKDAKAKKMEKIDKTAKDFEAVFLGQMLQPMFNTVEVDPLMGGGHAEEIYRSMLADEYGKMLAQHGGVGIAASVKKEMLKIQASQGK